MAVYAHVLSRFSFGDVLFVIFGNERTTSVTLVVFLAKTDGRSISLDCVCITSHCTPTASFEYCCCKGLHEGPIAGRDSHQ